jgi:hypothetical protein
MKKEIKPCPSSKPQTQIAEAMKTNSTTTLSLPHSYTKLPFSKGKVKRKHPHLQGKL